MKHIVVTIVGPREEALRFCDGFAGAVCRKVADNKWRVSVPNYSLEVVRADIRDNRFNATARYIGDAS